MKTSLHSNLENSSKPLTISIKNKFIKQLAKLGIKNQKELTITLLVTLMGNIIEDFTEDRLTMQDLSAMFSALWEEFYFHRTEEEKDTFSEIIDVLRYVKEIDYYTHDLDPYFFSCLQSIFKFYTKRNTILENVTRMMKEE
ncbi:MAG TPA: hypothetical protein VLG12_03625 [Candidatus Saccharimonadales bacterium]|nr:hypothetical protein [Candidatus Saccharimonadales bacterium]